MLRRQIMWALVLLGVLALPALAQDTIGPGDTVSGEANAVVSYNIDLEEGQSVSIAAESEDFDTYLVLLNSSGEEVAYDDDGGGGRNSRLNFVAPATDTYTINLRAFAGDPSGSYTLSVESLSISEMAYGESVTFEPDGSQSYFLAFQGSAGDVINLYAESEQDTRVVLADTQGQEIISDDDRGLGLNPYIRRYRLEETGMYQIVLETLFDDPLESPVTVTLEQTEPLLVGADGVEFVLGEVTEVEVLEFEALANTTYRIDFTFSDTEAYSQIEAVEADEMFFARVRATYSGVSEGQFVFTPEAAGRIRVVVQSSEGFRGLMNEVTISVRPVE